MGIREPKVSLQPKQLQLVITGTITTAYYIECWRRARQGTQNTALIANM